MNMILSTIGATVMSVDLSGFLSRKRLIISGPRLRINKVAKKAEAKSRGAVRPSTKQSTSLPSIEGIFPVLIPQVPQIDLAEYALCQSQLIPRLTCQLSTLSLSGHFDTTSSSWSHMERLPPEIIDLIAGNLAFFDKKALASTSRRIYGMLEAVKPPDRFSWRLHLCSAFNQAPREYFDFTLLEAEQVRLELLRLVRLMPETPRKGHYIFDPKSTRIKDITCLYFPPGFSTKFLGKHIYCRTLGQFIALQLHDYITAVIRRAKKAESQALRRRYYATEADISEEQKEILQREARQWRELHDLWLGGLFPLTSAHGAWHMVPESTWEMSKIFLDRMGYEELQGRLCANGKICELGEDFGVEIRKTSGVDDETSSMEASAGEEEIMDEDDDEDIDDDEDEENHDDNEDEDQDEDEE
ncbi:MAG: hypothetical protein Q9222_000215 [Ikaeria aurantiellina]